MTSPDLTTPPKRLFIPNDEETHALYARPCFTVEDRSNRFALMRSEKNRL